MSILYDPMVALVFYGTLALLAFWACRHNRDLFWLGAWLLAGFGISNALYFFAPLSARPGVYSMLEIMVLLAASIAWAEEKRARWPLLILGGVTVASIASNVAFAATMSPSPRQLLRWEVTTNICFAVECLLATWVGVADAFRAGRFTRLPGRGRRALAPDASREKQQ